MEPEQIHEDPERRSEEEINRFNKHAVSDSDFESNTSPRINDHDDTDHATRSEEEVNRIQLKPIHQAIESDQIHQDSKSRSEENINRIDEYGASDSDYDSIPTSEVYDHDDNDDGESYIEYENEKKMEPEQIHEDPERRSEEEINRFNKHAVSDSDFEGDATQRIKDHGDSDHETRTEEEINRIDKYDYDYDSATSTGVYDKDDISQTNDETDKNDYIDYSYAEIATHKKTTGTKYEDISLPDENKRKDKPRKEIPWIKKFKFRMVGNKVVMVLRKAV